MITKAVFALCFPFMLVVLFTRVTFNHYVAIALTAALLFASYLKGYTETYFIVGLDVVSLVAGGLYMAKKRSRQKERQCLTW
ncbi:CsbA family protein [Bacillus velezensis]